MRPTPTSFASFNIINLEREREKEREREREGERERERCSVLGLVQIKLVTHMAW